MPASESTEGASVQYVVGHSTHLPDIYGETSITIVSGSLILKEGKKVAMVILDKEARKLLLTALSSGRTRSVVGPNRWLTIEYDDRGGILMTLPACPCFHMDEPISVFVEYYDIQWLVGAITNGLIAMKVV